MSQEEFLEITYDPRSTTEQISIYDFVRFSEGNLLIRARAGSGKTTTLVEISKIIPTDCSSTFLAYNRHIKKELKSKLPSHVFCYTLHGLGKGAIMRKYKDCVVDEFKSDKVIQKHLKKWNLDQIIDVGKYLGNIKKIVDLVRLTLTSNKSKVLDLCEKYGIEFLPEDVDRVFLVLEEMLNDKKTMDFTDMVYLPVADPKIWIFPQDYVLVDEAQDLNKAQQELIKKMVKRDKSGKQTGRLIFVGDDMQAIYGFTGSDTYSFLNLSKLPNTTVLPLTTTFRCGRLIVEEAKTIVSDIKAMDNAHEGLVRILDKKQERTVLDEARDGDFILSRKTLPLVKLFFEFLVANKKAHINGSDIGNTLIAFTENSKSLSQLDATLTNKIKDFQKKLTKAGILNFDDNLGYVDLTDKVGILRFLMKMVKTIDDLKQRINYIFRDNDSSGIILSTVHKAKGLEADRVFIVMPKDMPLKTGLAWQYGQEINLKYIAITRAKNELIYDYKWDVDDSSYKRSIAA